MATQKGVILFVHGFGSSKKCWKPLLDLLEGDERVTQRYEFAAWDYPTSWFNLNVFGRIPRLQELGRGLGDRVDSPDFQNRELTLVGHSQGGLIIQSWIADVLQRGEGSRLRDVRQAIFFATPSHGSTMAMSLRLLFSTLFSNPQEIALRVLSPDVSDIRNVIRERVVATKSDGATAWRIPIHAFCGMEDGIVLEDSARGPFDSVTRVRGNHFTILRPKNREDDRYREFVELLLGPGGHTQRFEIDEYKTVLRVEPRDDEQVAVKSERNPRTVTYNNYATMNRAVRFAARNRCKNPFAIRYATQKNGYVVGHPGGPNLAPPEALGRWEDGGDEYEYDFVPESGTQYCLNVEVFKGYDEGQREAHFHLKDHSHYRHMEYVLDLSAYVAAGYRVSRGPCFYLHPQDQPHGDMCKSRPAREPLPPVAKDPNGTWTWELDDLHQGIVDIVWDVAKPTASVRLPNG
ncbi:MAG: alpha/beta fold hydrolase [Gemmatimonadales bacterium]